MPRFFVENTAGDVISISGDDSRHISRSLRMREGEQLTVCDGCGTDCLCEIAFVSDDLVELNVLRREQSESEPSVRVTVYQGYPKGDKLETIIEKAVEVGAYSVVPVLTERSVARPDGKSAAKKHERWQRHALEAAKQCGRGIIPEVGELVDFRKLEPLLGRHELCLFCYELGGAPLREAVAASGAKDIALFIGPEGGISSQEAEQLEKWGCCAVTLGKRILRTETAPIAAVSAIMCITGNMD